MTLQLRLFQLWPHGELFQADAWVLRTCPPPFFFYLQHFLTLALQGAPGSPYIFPLLALESATSSRSPGHDREAENNTPVTMACDQFLLGGGGTAQNNFYIFKGVFQKESAVDTACEPPRRSL